MRFRCGALVRVLVGDAGVRGLGAGSTNNVADAMTCGRDFLRIHAWLALRGGLGVVVPDVVAFEDLVVDEAIAEVCILARVSPGLPNESRRMSVWGSLFWGCEGWQLGGYLACGGLRHRSGPHQQPREGTQGEQETGVQS